MNISGSFQRSVHAVGLVRTTRRGISARIGGPDKPGHDRSAPAAPIFSHRGAGARRLANSVVRPADCPPV